MVKIPRLVSTVEPRLVSTVEPLNSLTQHFHKLLQILLVN